CYHELCSPRPLWAAIDNSAPQGVETTKIKVTVYNNKLKTHAEILLVFVLFIFSCSGRNAEDAPPVGLAKQMLEDSSYTWIAFKTSHFRFYYEADTYAAKHFAELRQGAEEARLHALKLLGEKNYAPIIDLFYLDSREKMLPVIGSQPKGWSDHQANTVLLACNEKIRPYHRHEIMHILSMNFWKTPPMLESWLLEGLAVYADIPCLGYSLHEIAAYLQRENKLVSLYSLVYRFRKLDDMLAYMQSGSLVQFLYEKYGREKFRSLWKQGIICLPEITGQNFREIEMEWQEFLQNVEPTKSEVDWQLLTEKGCG
ncbi:MAG: peptidase MA family metallohydrolase, partial [bacterium]